MTWTWHALHTCASRVNPNVHNPCFYTNAGGGGGGGYFEDVKPLWCGFREGVKPANCIRCSYERTVNDNRLQGLRGFMVFPTVWAWLAVCCVLLRCLTHPLFIRNPSKESSLCFYGAGLACRFSSAPGVEVLDVISSIIPSSVISALSCPMDLCLDLKDQATKCISRIFIAWTSTTITIKNPGDNQTCTWNLLWLPSASFGLKCRFGQFTDHVNHDSSRKQLALCGALIQ